MTKLPYRQAMLMKHTAWMNTRLIERGPRPEDERYVPLAVRMLTLVGCLNYAMLDLESELTASGLFRHETKRRYTQARTLVAQAHGIAWSMLRKIDDRAARQYNDKTDEAAAASCWRLLKGLTTSCCHCAGSSALSTVGFRVATTSTRPNLLYASRLCWSVPGSRITGSTRLSN